MHEMASDDDTLSQVTTSSSGIPDCNITILSSDKDKQLADEIEKELKGRNYSVAIPLCAGRLKVDNLVSRVKHAGVTVILLKSSTKKFIKSLDVVQQPYLIASSSAIILYKDGLKDDRLKPFLQSIVRIKLSESSKEDADHIHCFARVQTAQKRLPSTPKSIKCMFMDSLVDLIFNNSEKFNQCDVRLLENHFEEKYGLNLCDEDSFQECFDRSILFYLEDNVVKKRDVESSFLAEHPDPLPISNATDTDDAVSLTTEGARPKGFTSLLTLEPNISATRIVTSTPAWISPLDEDLSELARQLAVSPDSAYSFFLLSSKLKNLNDLGGIIHIPWLKVFDFDMSSRSDGLLSVVENEIRKRRSLSVSVPSVSSFKQLSERATDWFFPTGSSEDSGTSFDGNVLEWFDSNKEILEKQFSDIASFCLCNTVPVFIILWYNCSEKLTKCLDWCLSLLYSKISTKKLRKKIILCTDKPVSEKSDAFKSLISKYELEPTTINTSLSAVCKWMSQAHFEETTYSDALRLPKQMMDEYCDNTVIISQQDTAWLGKYIEMISVTDIDLPSYPIPEEAGLDFVRGGLIKWEDLSSSVVAVERFAESLVQIRDILDNELIEDKRSLIFKVLHEPGGGGTTFGRKLVHCLHREVPCGVILPKDSVSINEVVDRIEFLQKYTLLPLVLLADGINDYEVRQILEICKCTLMIIHLQRYNSKMLKNRFVRETFECSLPGSVTSEEAHKLEGLFRRFLPKQTYGHGNLANLAKQERSFIFEYGLTAFNYEYTGTRSFVRSYLNIVCHQFQFPELLPWQKVVAFLSLALYYGQTGLPKELFRKILNTGSEKFVTFDDLKSVGAELFIYQDQRNWRIRYFPIAKEILEQILSPSSSQEEYCSGEISFNACSNLHELVISFIRTISEVVEGDRVRGLSQSLQAMILRRDNRGKDKRNAYGKHRPLSRLLEHVQTSENRIRILQELTDAFPHHVDYHAHLGRLLSIANRFDDADKSLTRAINIIQKGGIASRDDIGRIHNMFGYACLSRAKYEIKRLPKEFNTKIMGTLSEISKSIQHFSDARRYISYNLSYSYFGEVKARLAAAKYVRSCFKKECLEVLKGKELSHCPKLGNFLQDSYSECAFLLDECLYRVSDEELNKVQRDLDACKGDFVYCFGCQPGELLGWRDNVQVRRSKIAALKSQEFRERGIYNLEAIKEKGVVEEIIRLRQENIKYALSNDDRSITILVDVLEWIDAIRFSNVDDTYGLAEVVLPVVEGWDKRKESIHSLYYRYIINFILAVYCSDENVSIRHNCEAKDLRERLRREKNWSTSKPQNQEILCRHSSLTIRKLFSAGRFSRLSSGKRYWRSHKDINRFQVCTGTIIRSRETNGGYIAIDIPHSSYQHRVEVFFVPLEYDLVGKRFSDEGTKVEFFIRFSVERGAEAIVVRKMNRGICPGCRKNKYLATLNQESSKCTHCI